MSTQHFKCIIVGGGSGGVSVAARLARESLAGSIALIDAAQVHHYQPYWTLISTGQAPESLAQKPMKDLIPAGVEWIATQVHDFDPDHSQLKTADGRVFSYDILVVATGLELRFDLIQGARESLGKNGVTSAYCYDQLSVMRQMIHAFKGGTAIFTMPPVPIKCAGAPQKVMYLADAVWRKTGVRGKTDIVFASAGATIFGVKEFAAPLEKVIQRKEIKTQFQKRLVEVKDKVAVFELPTKERMEMPFDFLHIVPPMSAPAIVRDSALASSADAQKGWLDVDKHSLQHQRYKNVFGIGDVTGIPNSKTGAAIRKQAPVVVSNIKSYLSQAPLRASYDGYSSCPLITDIGQVILAEFGYDGKLMPSFPLDPTKERRLYWHLKKDLLPRLYWHGMMKGWI